jgi:hypothetical protein
MEAVMKNQVYGSWAVSLSALALTMGLAYSNPARAEDWVTLSSAFCPPAETMLVVVHYDAIDPVTIAGQIFTGEIDMVVTGPNNPRTLVPQVKVAPDFDQEFKPGTRFEGRLTGCISGNGQYLYDTVVIN